MASWTAGHLTGNENEQRGFSKRGSRIADNGLYSFKLFSKRVSLQIITIPPCLIRLLIQAICHLDSLGYPTLSDFSSIQNSLPDQQPLISGIPLIVLDSTRIKCGFVMFFLILCQSFDSRFFINYSDRFSTFSIFVTLDLSNTFLSEKTADSSSYEAKVHTCSLSLSKINAYVIIFAGFNFFTSLASACPASPHGSSQYIL